MGSSMDAFKAQWERILQQLSALTATQKMLVAALVAVMVLTVLYWGRYAGNAEMVPVLDQTLSDDDIGPIDHQLELAGVPHSVSAGKVMVPADRKNEILANLMFARVLPQDTHSAFQEMSKQLNPFTTNDERNASYTEATSMELSSIIGQFPGVATARVIINAKNVARIEGGIPPSATVFITTKGDPEHVKSLVRAAADGVAHAVSGLVPSQISVIVNGTSMKAPDSEGEQLGGADDMIDLKQKNETRLEQKIRNQFSFITGLTVTVTCDVENRTMEESKTEYDKSKAVVEPAKTITNTEETSSSSSTSHEPGVSGNLGANGSASIDGASAASPPNTSSIEHTETTNNVLVPQTLTNTKIPAGKDSVEAATVCVPLSYFAAVFKQLNPAVKEPDADALAKLTTTELAKIRQGVKTVVGLKVEDNLTVDTYADAPVDLAMAVGPAAQVATLSTVSGHAKEIGVAVLAIVSLMMMATMVRKSAPAPMLLGGVTGSETGGGGGGTSTAAARAQMASLLGGEMVAGEVGAGSAALDGMEMDDDAVRTQQMLDQVSTMVKENPDGAASLVKRWLSRP